MNPSTAAALLKRELLWVGLSTCHSRHGALTLRHLGHNTAPDNAQPPTQIGFRPLHTFSRLRTTY